MLEGLLVINAFLKSLKFDGIYKALRDSAKANGIALSVTTNAEIATRIDNPEFLSESPDFVLFWDKDVKIAQLLEQRGMPVFNTSDSILKCDDKSLTYLTLRQAGVATPPTIILPQTFPSVGYPHTEFLDEAASRLGFPLVLKECYGSFGHQVYLFKDMESLREKVIQLSGRPMLLQRMVMSSYGRDVRVNVAGDRVVACILRESQNGDFRSNITLGGSMWPYTPTEDEAALALRAVKELGLTFAGVDVLFGQDGPLICEVNSNAHFKTTLDCTGINMADAIFQEIRKHIG